MFRPLRIAWAPSESQDSAQHLLRAIRVAVYGEEQGIAVVAPAMGQFAPEVAVEPVDLNLVRTAWDAAQRRQGKVCQPADDGAAAEVSATAQEPVPCMPNADALTHGVDDGQPDVPPVALARLQDGEAEPDMGTTATAQARDGQLDDVAQSSQLAAIDAIATEGHWVTRTAAVAVPRTSCSRPRVTCASSRPCTDISRQPTR
jgi:hypothetical protein